ncbi:hypothetical protein ACIQVC_37320 [Streptomyces sp. NPDC101112]|uniref:hypothetical protein n=1 Tax=Streptomyces sp. NPDC101112 TaxID=3366105 RepID=UPI00381CD365
MALGWTKNPEPDDPRLQGHETYYQSSRGGYFPPPLKPVAGTGQDEHSVELTRED